MTPQKGRACLSTTFCRISHESTLSRCHNGVRNKETQSEHELGHRVPKFKKRKRRRSSKLFSLDGFSYEVSKFCECREENECIRSVPSEINGPYIHLYRKKSDDTFPRPLLSNCNIASKQSPFSKSLPNQ